MVTHVTMRLFLCAAAEDAAAQSLPLLIYLAALRQANWSRTKNGEVIASASAAGHTVNFHFGADTINPLEAAEIAQVLWEMVGYEKSADPAANDETIKNRVLQRLVPYSRRLTTLNGEVFA